MSILKRKTGNEPETISLKAKSSSGDKIYSVTFIFDGNKMIVKCNCPAGRYGNFCKHKWAFIKGQDFMLYDEDDDDQHDQLQYVAERAQKSDYLDSIINLSKIQKIIDDAELEAKQLRKKVAIDMKKGVNYW